MPRVTGGQVKVVIDTELEDLTPFIGTANLMIDEQLVGKGMTDARLDKIALYLSAHFVTMRERQLKSENFGDSSETYQGDTGMNLQSSLYGQTALSLDTTGTLHNAGNSFAEMELL